ncbi:hypothetical protein B2G69_01225 [Methylorubrum zatmanii]|nr:hypothetical protein [Methylorubrum zatmanii]ARO52895.1 hypothetical protein B2G69_01225 [Methylorubrum zatmanii]
MMSAGSAPSPARRVAQLLRQRPGSDFDALIVDIKACNFCSFQWEVARIPADEAADRRHREREARAGEMAEAAKTLPLPESPEEAGILRCHGFMLDGLAPELDRTAP